MLIKKCYQSFIENAEKTYKNWFYKMNAQPLRKMSEAEEIALFDKGGKLKKIMPLTVYEPIQIIVKCTWSEIFYAHSKCLICF